MTSSAIRPASVANGSAASAGIATTAWICCAGDDVGPVGRALLGAAAPARGERARREPERDAEDERGRVPYAFAGAPEVEAALRARRAAARGWRDAGRGSPPPRRRRRRRPTSGSRRGTRRPAARSRRRSRRATRSEERGTRRARRAPAVSATQTATPKKTPPHVATILPPFAKRRNSGRQCPSIAAAPATMPERWCGETKSIPSSAGTKPLSTSSSTTGRAEPAAVGAPDVRRADVAGADLADVLVLERAGRASSPTGTSPGDSRARRGPRKLTAGTLPRQGRTPYRCAQSLTTS